METRVKSFFCSMKNDDGMFKCSENEKLVYKNNNYDVELFIDNILIAVFKEKCIFKRNDSWDGQLYHYGNEYEYLVNTDYIKV